jgi:hypothetical protein
MSFVKLFNNREESFLARLVSSASRLSAILPEEWVERLPLCSLHPIQSLTSCNEQLAVHRGMPRSAVRVVLRLTHVMEFGYEEGEEWCESTELSTQ